MIDDTIIKGTILAYSDDVNAGVIDGDDGRKYPFAATEWLATSKPQNNMSVVFTPSAKAALKVNKV